ncbi:hypothetical protein [Rubrivivax rivuli]|uniref:Uncharacterized protein n=1 Tax=Rubrivivax rivuli TaxID=1862385 RepID=A0A437R827_9BURK|nr:hypothetical protein [Rubrivivax rivuli]RVU42847.1 hypothetical protein EOE66_21465 [Rubrivivax rivuli]
MIRITDDNTPQESNSWRDMSLRLGSLVWLAAFVIACDKITGSAWRENWFVLGSFLAGAFLAFAAFTIAARARPGFLGAKRYTKGPPLEYLSSAPQTLGAWLNLDLRNLSKAVRLRIQAQSRKSR